MDSFRLEEPLKVGRVALHNRAAKALRARHGAGPAAERVGAQLVRERGLHVLVDHDRLALVVLGGFGVRVLGF